LIEGRFIEKFKFIYLFFSLGYTTVLGDKDKAAMQVDKILEEVDSNKSGKVDFTGNSNYNYTLLKK